MGQQETTMRATGSALRRMILVLAVAAVMVAVSAMPALALAPEAERGCRTILEKAPSNVVSKLINGGNHPCFQS
jgi:lipopolysaccharide export LptBFGC system permease protein LptF